MTFNIESLTPCPCCGGKPIIHREKVNDIFLIDKDDFLTRTDFYLVDIRCSNCNRQTSRKHVKNNIPDSVLQALGMEWNEVIT